MGIELHCMIFSALAKDHFTQGSGILHHGLLEELVTWHGHSPVVNSFAYLKKYEHVDSKQNIS